MTTNAYARGVRERGWESFPGRLWQRNYYEHIVRTERSLERIRDYIATNPATWDVDAENPSAGTPDAGAYYRALWRA
jgi:REP element-mobilizing transposase RayT